MLAGLLRNLDVVDAAETGGDDEENGTFGRPGTRPRQSRSPATMASARGLEPSGWATSWPRLESDVARVTMMPVAVENRSAAICETRPSPMVRSVRGAPAPSGSACATAGRR